MKMISIINEEQKAIIVKFAFVIENIWSGIYFCRVRKTSCFPEAPNKTAVIARSVYLVKYFFSFLHGIAHIFMSPRGNEGSTIAEYYSLYCNCAQFVCLRKKNTRTFFIQLKQLRLKLLIFQFYSEF